MFTIDNLYGVHKKVYNLLPYGIGRLLDLACQECGSTKYYLKKADSVVGLDFLYNFLVKGKRIVPELKLVNSLAEDFPFKNDIFDYCLLTEMLGCVSDQRKCLAETLRVLKSGGIIVISVPQKGLFYFLDPDNFKFYFPNIYRIFYRILKKKEPEKSFRFSRKDDYYYHYSFNEIKDMLGPKFEINRIYRGGLIIYPLAIGMNYVFNLFGWKRSIVLKSFNVLSDWEYNINFGPLAYNLLILAKKVS